MRVKGFGCLAAVWGDDDNIISIIENLSHQQANMPYIGTNQLFSTRNLASLCYILFLFCSHSIVKVALFSLSALGSRLERNNFGKHNFAGFMRCECRMTNETFILIAHWDWFRFVPNCLCHWEWELCFFFVFFFSFSSSVFVSCFLVFFVSSQLTSH